MTGAVPLADQVACVARELKLRHAAYPKWVASGRMKQAEADKEIVRMTAVLDTLKGLDLASVLR